MDISWSSDRVRARRRIASVSSKADRRVPATALSNAMRAARSGSEGLRASLLSSKFRLVLGADGGDSEDSANMNIATSAANTAKIVAILIRDKYPAIKQQTDTDLTHKADAIRQ